MSGSLGTPFPRRPLVPLAVAVGLGVAAETWLPLSDLGLVAWATGAGVGWVWALRRDGTWRQAGALLLTAALAAAWHRLALLPPRDDVADWATPEGTFVQLRGWLQDPPRGVSPAEPELRSLGGQVTTYARLVAQALELPSGWRPVTGSVRLILTGPLPGFHAGDGVVAWGRLTALEPPLNPGERETRWFWQARGIRAVFLVKNAAGCAHWSAGDQPYAVSAWLQRVRARAEACLQATLPPATVGVAQALICGQGFSDDGNTAADYQRAGVYHVLVVSGQHLVLLCGALAWLLGQLGVRGRPRAGVLAGFALFYAALTGNEPPALRAAVVVVAGLLAAQLQRRPDPVNSLALAWLVLGVLAPADLTLPGCHLSFLATLVLLRRQAISAATAPPGWSLSFPDDRDDDALTSLQPLWLRWGGQILAAGRAVYLTSLVVWLAVTPLVAAHFHIVAPVAVLLGPPLSLIMGLALLGGFLLAGLGLVLEPDWLAPLGWAVALLLSSANAMVAAAVRIPGAYWYCPDLPGPWLALGYVVLLAALLRPNAIPRPGMAAGAGLLWLGGCVIGSGPAPPSGLRATILAVGHGSCAVLEAPNGRVVLYDAGALQGPPVITRRVAPYLWHRGYTRIDEVLLSHADLDHFNGLPALLERFTIGQISTTPSFFHRANLPVRLVASRIAQENLPVRTVRRGQRFQLDADIWWEVLHPPATGPPGPENARSLTLLVHAWGQTLLLTGDLEPPGLGMVLARPAPPVDVVVAPHPRLGAVEHTRVRRLVSAGVGDLLGRRASRSAARSLSPARWPALAHGQSWSGRN